MAKPMTYREQEKIENTVKLREFLQELPPYVKDYFRAKEPTTSDKTRLSYAYDLRVFFRFLQESNPALMSKPMADISHPGSCQPPACGFRGIPGISEGL